MFVTESLWMLGPTTVELNIRRKFFFALIKWIPALTFAVDLGHRNSLPFFKIFHLNVTKKAPEKVDFFSIRVLYYSNWWITWHQRNEKGNYGFSLYWEGRTSNELVSTRSQRWEVFIIDLNLLFYYGFIFTYELRTSPEFNYWKQTSESCKNFVTTYYSLCKTF